MKLLRAGLFVLVVLVAVVWWNTRSAETPREERQAEQRDQDATSAPGTDPVRYIRDVEIWSVPEGTVYSVHPSREGRLADSDALQVAWRQAVRRGVPDESGLKHQFLCHPLSVVARAKPTWDLESWRPNVGQVRTMLAGCNPD